MIKKDISTFCSDAPSEDLSFGSDNGDVLRAAGQSVDVDRQQSLDQLGLSDAVPVAVAQAARRSVAASHHDTVVTVVKSIVCS